MKPNQAMVITYKVFGYKVSWLECYRYIVGTFSTEIPCNQCNNQSL